MSSYEKFVIEREIPGAGKMSQQEIKAASANSCEVLRSMGTDIQWLESYVADDKIYCVYLAANEQLVREHAEKAGLPANRVSRVSRVIDPTTASAG